MHPFGVSCRIRDSQPALLGLTRFRVGYRRRLEGSGRDTLHAIFFRILAQCQQFVEVAGCIFQSALPIIFRAILLALLLETARQIHVLDHRIQRKTLRLDGPADFIPASERGQSIDVLQK